MSPYSAGRCPARPLRHGVVSFAVFVLVLGLPGVGSAQVSELGPGGTFQDDNSSVHEADIEALAAAGITRGCNPPVRDHFCPDLPVTRAEMAAFLVRALGLEPSSTDAFADDDDSIFEDDIDALAAAGITTGCGSESYCPSDAIDRGEMAAFLNRGYELEPGATPQFVDVAGSVFAGDIAALAASDITLGCNPPANDKFCPTDPVTRAQMASFLVRAEGLAPIPAPDPVSLKLMPFVTGLASPVHIAAPAGDDRLFVVEKAGRIRIVENDKLAAKPFLDISSVVNDRSGEMGLLSMAFHPDFAVNGRFFVAYSGAVQAGGSGHHTEYISEYRVSEDPSVALASGRVVLAVDQPRSNHNGGHVLFGPDGNLYIALGDGGGGGDPFENGQDRNTLLGSILRLDVDGAEPYEVPPDNPFVGREGADEIWAIGLRNPWRIWFDEDLLYVADVGQESREEVSVVPSSIGGLNFGWDVQEGSACHEPRTGCDTSGTVQPLVELSHGSGACSITGGVVYRGTRIPQLRGRYIFADLCIGHVEAIVTNGSKVIERTNLRSQIGSHPGIWSFGVDGMGEVYLAFGGSGTVQKFVGE